jgi:hypothetical protein
MVQNSMKLSLTSLRAKFMFLQLYKSSTVVDLGSDRMGACRNAVKSEFLQAPGSGVPGPC